MQASTSQDDTNLDNLLTKFWTQEEVPVSANASLTSEEAHCENHFVTTHSRDSTGRYVVRLPLKEPASVLGDSFTRARACLRGIISKHNKDPEYKQMYEAFMKEYAQLQHMTQVSSKPPTTPVYYLPHHGVLKLASYLTDQLQPPRENPSTRSYITKMNRQILVDERDVDLQRIVYFDENSNETHWQLKTVTYGIRAAPYLAVRSLLQLVKDEGHRFPSAIDSLTKGRYVDDIFGGAHSDEQLKHVAQDLTDLCMAGGFLLAKWNSNSEAFRADLPDSNSSNTISLDDCKAKIPGLYWDTHEDSLKFKVMLTPPQRNISKRSILSEVAQIFDPLGIISPVTIKAKVLLQELWLHKLKWDETVPESIRARWILMRQDFLCLNTLSLPGWLNTSSDATIQLHGFSDAFQFAMSAVLYIRVHSKVTRYSSHFVCSKTKVAPLKNLSIPRLELSAAHLLARLTRHILDTLNFHVHSTHLWTDSQVTLAWITSHASRWKNFVRNRVAHIQEVVPSAQWRHVPGTLNPADCASRGVTVEQLSEHNLWWHGPQWLLESEERWPTQRDSLDFANVPEQRRIIAAAVATQDVENYWLPLEKFSSFVKLQRATATVLLACQRLKKLSASSDISIENLKSATHLLIKLTQQHHFASELQLLINGDIPRSHVFNRLTAFIDSQGIIRVGG
uniref:Reverse transcriptase domain-containing protein n=1 Tax=Trichogramma kaykai TaxID=54128 RepID=A0ABD2XQ08_9HYME